MKKILVAAILITLAPATLLADVPGAPSVHPSRGEDLFKRWDTNGDGVISREEAQAAGADRIARSFDKLDINKDGQLTPDEVQQAHADRFAARKEHFDAQFKAADKNSDGSLSKEEAQQGMPMLAQHFDEIDTNQDGLVSPEELKGHHMAMMHHGWHGGSTAPPAAPQGQQP